MNQGRPGKRGRGTFVCVDDAEFTPGKMVEVVMSGPLSLPTGIEMGVTVRGPWRPASQEVVK